MQCDHTHGKEFSALGIYELTGKRNTEYYYDRLCTPAVGKEEMSLSGSGGGSTADIPDIPDIPDPISQGPGEGRKSGRQGTVDRPLSSHVLD